MKNLRRKIKKLILILGRLILGPINLQTKQNMEMGNHMFFVFDNVKRRFVIYGGSNKFDREYGMCGDYYDDLIVGVQDCKRMKMGEELQKSDVGDKVEQAKKVDESEKENLPTMG